MEMEEDSSSRTVDSPANYHKPHHHHDPRKLEVYNDVLLRLRGEPEAQLPSFHDHLWAHFHRLPARYALDVNVERAEEVLTHKRLLEMAADHPNGPVFDVRVVQVRTLSDGSSPDLQMLGEHDSSSSLSHMSVHPPPAFDSSPSSGALAPEAAKFQLQDGDDVENVNSLVSRVMHEITFSADDRPKLLSQLTCLLGEVGLNIQEAHVFSTNDGYSLDVFVVDGWPYEETEQLRQAIQKELLKFEKQSLSIPDQFPFMLEEAQTGDNFALDRVEIPADETDVWEIDIRRLRFEKKVASGTYGELYKGTYCTQDVAIKVLNSERVNADLQREFAQEVYIMQKVRHRNVVQFIGACTRPPSLCIVTEFMSGGSLYDYLHKHKGSFKIPSLLRVAIDVSKGMNYLHQNNIIHRDLKAANLLMDENEVVKVADFGVARVKSKSGVMTAETGTYRWMAPEVIEHKPYDHKADVFSFAIVLWELLTGKVPHEFLTPLQAAVGVVRKGLRPTIPKNTHPKLVELLQKCWQQDPSLRPDFSEILEILQCVSTEIAHETEERRRERPSSSGIFSALRRGQ